MCQRGNTYKQRLAGQAAQKFLLVHVVLEGFMAIDKDDGDLVIELPAKFRVRIYVNFLPRKRAAASEFGEALFDHLAEMTSLARVDDDLSKNSHVANCSVPRSSTPVRNCEEVKTKGR